MKLLGEKSALIEVQKVPSGTDLFEVKFSCEWCKGNFQFFSNEENISNLKQVCSSISSGKKKNRWMSEEGDLELIFKSQSNGLISTSVICYPSVKLQKPGKIEFQIEIGINSFG